MRANKGMRSIESMWGRNLVWIRLERGSPIQSCQMFFQNRRIGGQGPNHFLLPRPKLPKPRNYCLECFFLLRNRFGLVWFGLIMRGKNSWILLAKFLARILYMLPKSVIGCQFPSFEWSPNFRIKVIMPLLMYSKVNPCASMALKANSSVGATSFTYSWKNFVWIPSCSGALPLGSKVMASMIFARDKGLGHVCIHGLCESRWGCSPNIFLVP